MSQELQIHPWKRHFLIVTLQFLWRKHSGTPVWPICLNIKVFRPSTPTFLAAGELGDENNQPASSWVDLAGAPQDPYCKVDLFQLIFLFIMYHRVTCISMFFIFYYCYIGDLEKMSVMTNGKHRSMENWKIVIVGIYPNRSK